MRTATIGSLEVSVIGLGCNNFGRGLDLQEAKAVVDAALGAGITFFDTADRYGGGFSESILAEALGNERDRVVIATKFGGPPIKKVPGMPNEGKGRPHYVRAAVEKSLRQLKRDHIDLYQMHHPDPATPISETLGALSELVDLGKVREIGCSNFNADQLAEALACDSPHHFVSDQIEYSIANRAPERDGLFDLAESTGVALLPYRPLAKGLLTGKYRNRRQPESGVLSEGRYQRFLTDRNWGIVEGLREFAEARGVPMVQVSLAWLLHRPTVPAVIPGAMNPDQVQGNAGTGVLHLSEQELSELDSIVGPFVG